MAHVPGPKRLGPRGPASPERRNDVRLRTGGTLVKTPGATLQVLPCGSLVTRTSGRVGREEIAPYLQTR